MKVLNNLDLNSNKVENTIINLDNGGTGTDILGQEVGLIGYGNNGNSLEILPTISKGFLYSHGGGKQMPMWKDNLYITHSGLSTVTMSSVVDLMPNPITATWHYKRWSDDSVDMWLKWQGKVEPYYTNPDETGVLKYSYTISIPLPFTFNSTLDYAKTFCAQTGSGASTLASGGLNDTTDHIALHWYSNVDGTGNSTVQVHVSGQL